MAPIRRPWTWEEVEKLLNMAQKYPAAQIASEIGRAEASVRTKAHELSISLRMDRRRPGASGLDLPGWERGHRYRCWCCVEAWRAQSMLDEWLAFSAREGRGRASNAGRSIVRCRRTGDSRIHRTGSR
jgi:hypothetical protein